MKHDVWVAIAVLTVVCFAIKAAGPVALGGRDLPPAAERLIVLLPAALLSALVVVQTFASGRELVLDARLAGVAAAMIAIALRASVLVVLLGGQIADPKALGLDALFPAFFLVLVVGELNDRAARVSAAAGGLIALALIPLTPPGIPVICACAGVLVGRLVARS